MQDMELIGTTDAARILGVHPSTVARKVAAGKLTPAQVIPGYRGDFLFDRAEIEAQAAEQ